MWSQRNGRLSTITKVKVLSLEMFIACNRSRENRIFVTASEAKQSNIAERLRLLRPKGLAMTQKRHIYCVNAYHCIGSGLYKVANQYCCMR
jgi:hypothetical protein